MFELIFNMLTLDSILIFQNIDEILEQKKKEKRDFLEFLLQFPIYSIYCPMGF